MPDDLEHELRQLPPTAPSKTLEAQIAQSLAHSAFRIPHSAFRPRPLADKILATTLSLAAAAAILIVALLTTDYVNNPPSPPAAQVAGDSSARPTLADTQRLLAQLTNDAPPFPTNTLPTTHPE